MTTQTTTKKSTVTTSTPVAKTRKTTAKKATTTAKKATKTAKKQVVIAPESVVTEITATPTEPTVVIEPVVETKTEPVVEAKTEPVVETKDEPVISKAAMGREIFDAELATGQLIRKNVINRLMKEAGLTKAGAATYFQNMKKKAGLVNAQ